MKNSTVTQLPLILYHNFKIYHTFDFLKCLHQNQNRPKQPLFQLKTIIVITVLDRKYTLKYFN